MRPGILTLFVFAGCAFAQPPPLIAIRNAKIVPVSGAVLETGTVILKDGLIAEVGASPTIPPGAWILEGKGLTVYPGFIDALSLWALPESAAPVPSGGRRGGGAAPATTAGGAPPPAPARGPEDRPATTSWLKAADVLLTVDPRIETARAAGFTTAVSFPKRGIIAGHGSVINLGGETAGQMIVAPDAGLFLTLSTSGAFGSYPGSLMGTIAYIRQVWLDAEHYRLAKEMYAKSPSTIPRPAYDRAIEGVLEAKRILLPATTKVQIDRMIRFAAELKTPAVLYGLYQGYRAADAIKASGMPVVLNVKWPTKPRDSDPDDEDSFEELETRDKAPSTPGVLAAAGVKFAFSSEGLEAPRDLVRAVKKAIDAGLKPEQAIRALTLTPAEIYGVSGRLGSIERGKIANLTVVKGDIFDEKPEVQMVFIDGVKYLPAPTSAPAESDRGARPSGQTPFEVNR